MTETFLKFTQNIRIPRLENFMTINFINLLRFTSLHQSSLLILAYKIFIKIAISDSFIYKFFSENLFHIHLFIIQQKGWGKVSEGEVRNILSQTGSIALKCMLLFVFLFRDYRYCFHCPFNFRLFLAHSLFYYQFYLGEYYPKLVKGEIKLSMLLLSYNLY